MSLPMGGTRSLSNRATLEVDSWWRQHPPQGPSSPCVLTLSLCASLPRPLIIQESWVWSPHSYPSPILAPLGLGNPAFVLVPEPAKLGILPGNQAHRGPFLTGRQRTRLWELEGPASPPSSATPWQITASETPRIVVKTGSQLHAASFPPSLPGGLRFMSDQRAGGGGVWGSSRRPFSFPYFTEVARSRPQRRENEAGSILETPAF